MSEQKWAVMSAEGSGWLVVHPGDVIRTDDGLLDCWEVHNRHHTWEEAMQEADRMARTITVTLPADPAAVLPEIAAVAYDRGYDLWIERTYRVAGHREITISDEYRESIALALLAHARKETN